MSDLIIYHNPRCSKSRQTLELLRQQNLQPEVVEYLKNPPSEKTLKDILQRLDMRASDLLRKKETIYKELELANKDSSDAELISLMHEHPKLIERPIVLYKGNARIGRPPEAVLELFA
ncbi:arsenate reductase (glutaredoxin) [Aliidiomarina minuta]|uniref:Arsenate reductase n=1 Tax=Aliidiomarina minuta TaxID=880057 RepID=A0A432W734_9GAMM|nr:arsenate reductase (glutaredoxin) [Aliidiomarina minuta]RUO25893.1 arsenate reductase (glutaredoxin) [Aliidiomarina minuta]